MVTNPTAWCRWLGVLSLAIAGAMLLIGETVLQGQLRPVAFLLYWLVCFAFTGLAICVALLDALLVRRRNRQAEQELLRNTLGQIPRRRRPLSPDHSGPTKPQP